MAGKAKPVDERFFSKVDFDEWNRDDCWPWKGSRRANGYGEFTVRSGEPRQRVAAHIFAYEFFNGPVPVGKELHHNCENRLCVNPSHLEPLTRADHRNRSPKFLLTLGRHNRVKTHCPKAHPYNGVNLYTTPDGERGCRQCRREARRRCDGRKRNASR
jgi:hypothetical protein